jgi:hypothetical protein
LTRTLRVALPLTCLVLLAAVPAFGACGNDDDDAPDLGNNVTDEAQRLAEAFFAALASGDRDRVDRVISPAFVLVRANGDVHDRDSYLQNLPTVNTFAVSNVKAVQRGPVLIASYTVVTDQVIDGRQQPTNPAPRLTTFAWDDGRWLIVSHANFNAILPGNQ